MSSIDKLIINLISAQSRAPTREPDSVGYDVYAYGDHILSPNETRIVPLGIRVALPHGHAAFLWDRSSFGAKGIHIFRQLVTVTDYPQDQFQIVPFGGVIDWSYRGQVGAILHNFMPGQVYWIRHGDRIAQMVIQKCELLPIEIVDDDDYMQLESIRGIGGFGSSDSPSPPSTDTDNDNDNSQSEQFRMKQD
jgi:dUTP pyrophosphatase